MTEIELTVRGVIDVLGLGPRDRLLITVDRPLSMDYAEALQIKIQEWIGVSVPVLIVDSGFRFSVASPETLPELDE